MLIISFSYLVEFISCTIERRKVVIYLQQGNYYLGEQILHCGAHFPLRQNIGSKVIPMNCDWSPNYIDLFDILCWNEVVFITIRGKKKKKKEKEKRSGPSHCDFTFHLWVRRDHFNPESDLNAYGGLTIYVLPYNYLTSKAQVSNRIWKFIKIMQKYNYLNIHQRESKRAHI